MVQLTCPFLCHTSQMSRDSSALLRPSVCLFVYGSGAQVVRVQARVITQTNEWQ